MDPVTRIVFHKQLSSSQMKTGQVIDNGKTKPKMIPVCIEWRAIDMCQVPIEESEELLFLGATVFLRSYSSQFPETAMYLDRLTDETFVLNVYMWDQEVSDRYFATYIGKQTPFKDERRGQLVTTVKRGFPDCMESMEATSFRTIACAFVMQSNTPKVAVLLVHDGVLHLVFRDIDLLQRIQEIRSLRETAFNQMGEYEQKKHLRRQRALQKQRENEHDMLVQKREQGFKISSENAFFEERGRLTLVDQWKEL